MGVYVIVPLTKLSSAGGGQLQSMDQIWPTACFFKQNFIGAQLNGFADVLSVYGVLSCCTSRAEKLPHRDYMACKALNIHYLALYRRNLLTFSVVKQTDIK